jgi:hypothetical protein
MSVPYLLGCIGREHVVIHKNFELDIRVSQLTLGKLENNQARFCSSVSDSINLNSES